MRPRKSERRPPHEATENEASLTRLVRMDGPSTLTIPCIGQRSFVQPGGASEKIEGCPPESAVAAVEFR